MASTDPQRWAQVRSVAGMHLAGLRPDTWYRIVPAPTDAAAHMRDDVWLEVDGRVQWYGQLSALEIRGEAELDQRRRFSNSRLSRDDFPRNRVAAAVSPLLDHYIVGARACHRQRLTPFS
jgi:hypothetical protein